VKYVAIHTEMPFTNVDFVVVVWRQLGGMGVSIYTYDETFESMYALYNYTGLVYILVYFSVSQS